MTKTNCDICKKELDFNHSNPYEINGDAVLVVDNEVREFSFTCKVGSYKFSCTNFHVCIECVFNAIARNFKSKSEKVSNA